MVAEGIEGEGATREGGGWVRRGGRRPDRRGEESWGGQTAAAIFGMIERDIDIAAREPARKDAGPDGRLSPPSSGGAVFEFK